MAQQTFEEIVDAVKQAESRGKRYAADGKTLTTSPKGALGEMQVMPKTIRDPGFGVAPAKDKSPDEIARVGRDYLQAMLSKYGDTDKALIAYNMGPGVTDKWLASGANPEKLPAETRTYVQRVNRFLGKDVPRETTVVKKEREPLPASLPPMAQADIKSEVRASSVKPEAAARVASLGPGYQAALALSFLADTDDEKDRETTITQEFMAKAQEEEDDRAASVAARTRQANVFADLSNTTIRSPFAEPPQPVRMKDGGDVGAFERLVPRRAERRLTPQQMEGFVAEGSQSFEESKAKNLMERFNQLISDNPALVRARPLSPLGVLLNAGYGTYQYVTGKDPLRDLDKAAYKSLYPETDTGSDTGSEPISVGLPPVNRAQGSPKEGERKLDRETMDMLRRQGTSPASLKRVASPADIASSAAGLPGLMLFADPRIDNTNAYGYVLDSSDNKKNFGMAQAMFLNKSRSEDYPDTIAHETEHLLARQNLGSAANINSKFDELIGNKGTSRLNFVRDAVKAAPYLKEKYDLQSSYLDPKMFEYQSKFGLGKNLLYEQLASLAALEQRHKVDLTKDPELRKTLFSRPDVRETYNALTGLRQTRLDPRDLPPHTRVREPGMLDAIKGVFKRADGGPVYRAEGSPEEGEIEEEEATKPFIGNPNIRRQVGQARRNAAIQKASYRDEVAEAKDTARKGDAYQELEKYLQSRDAVPNVKVTSYLPEGTHGMFSSDRANILTGNIKINKNLPEMYMPSTIAHEVTHAADRQMEQQAMEQGLFGKSNQFTEAYKKMVGKEGRNRTQLLRKRYPEFEEDNRYYRSRPDEVAAHGIGAYSGPVMQDSAPRHVDATAATEFRILMDLAQRNVDKGPKGLGKILPFFRKIEPYAAGGEVEQERLTMQQIERIAAREAAEREAASTPAFIAQKSGIGRKAGPVSQALQSGQGYVEAAKGLTMMPQNFAGAAFDLSNMVAGLYGGNVDKPIFGSENLKEQSRKAGLAFKPSDDSTLAAFFGAGDLGSNLVNPAGLTRTGVKAAEKTGEAARMLAQDFQQYNQNLPAPGASYAIRNRSTPFIMTPERTTVSGQIVPEMNEADAYADRVARTVDTGANLRTDNPALANWFRTKVGAYLRRDFGTEQDQMVQAADKGMKMHFTSPRFLENNPYLLNPNTIGTGRELEGFPKAGFAKTAKGQEAEAIVDSSIYPLQLQDVSEKYVPSNMKQFRETNPEMRLSEMGSYVDENLKLELLADEMDNMFKETVFKAYGEQVPMPKDYILTEDTLKGLTPAQASNRVARKQEWVTEKRGELAGIAIAKDPQIVSHSYDNGSKWISPPDLADNARHEEMVKDIGCAGGWCTDKSTYALDFGSGENRLNILLDKKFEPRVQLTVNSPPISVREFILANPHLPEIDALTRDRTLTSKRAEAYIKTMPEYLDFVKQNQGVKRITEIKGQFNNPDLKNSPYLKQVQDFVKRQGPDLLNVHNLEGINMVDARVELAKKNSDDYMKKFKNGYIDKLRELNGNSFYVDQGELPELLKKTDDYMPSNAARAIQMNLFQTKATGGMIERHPDDNRRYM